MAISPPQPSVLHLVTLFRQISSGDIRIPAFQREFIWREKQMIELLESVLEGYPIGSILLWGVDRKILNIAPSEASSFPAVEEHYPSAYVLDGMQRLSTLYGVFHFGTSTQDERFDILYDLNTERFYHRSDDELEFANSVPLAALFTPRRLLEHQSRLSDLQGGDALIEKLLQVQAAFQEYMLPVVTIRSTDIHRIVGIFEKINSTGTKLDPVDFMRAITWAEDFDLNHSLDAAASELQDVGIDISSETLIKCVGMVLGIPPTTDGLLQLRNQEPEALNGAFTTTINSMKSVSEFLEKNFHILSSDFVPYEGQLLLLFKAVGLDKPSSAEEDRIVRWFWASGFNESLRGKPDHYVVRAVDDWRGLVQGKVRGLEPRLKLSPIELFERRLVGGGALSTTFATLHAANTAKSFLTGTPIDMASYMVSSYSSWFEPVFSRQELVSNGFSDALSARLFGNVVLIDRNELKTQGLTVKKAIIYAADKEAWEVLESQFIDSVAISALRENNVQGFMMSRVENMHAKALQLVGK